jgi:hypothetical protein
MKLKNKAKKCVSKSGICPTPKECARAGTCLLAKKGKKPGQNTGKY